MRRNALAIFAALGVLLLLSGCLGLGTQGSEPVASPGGISTGGAPRAAESAQAYGGVNIPQQYLDSSGRMVIKSGSAQVQVPAGTLDDRYASLKALVNSSSGYVYAVQYGETASSKYYDVTVKLPPAAFENMPQALKSIGELKSVDTNTQDVTEQYVDINVRIQNLQAEKVRLLEFYNRTANVSELLEVEREVTRVQTEIEQLTAQKLQMERRAELSTMQIRIYEEAPMVDRTVMVPLSALASIFLQALSLAITIIVALSGFGIPFIVGILVLVAIFLGIKKITSGKKAK